MYVSVPKNYGGVAFSHGQQKPPKEKDEPPKEEQAKETVANECASCKKEEKNPLSCLLSAFRGSGKNGFASEDFLLLGLIALLIGKEGNEDILLILAMLLLT